MSRMILMLSAAVAIAGCGGGASSGQQYNTAGATAPTVSITAPASGAMVSGTITVTASVADNVRVAGVQFKYDGINLGAEVTAPPYAVPANTTAVADGWYSFTAVARDAAGSLTTSAPVIVAIANSTTTPPPPASGITFPRLLGMNIGAKNYNDPNYQRDLARLDAVILGFYKDWNPAGYGANSALAIQKAVRAIKTQNPGILVGQYTILNEAYDNVLDAATLDLRDKLYASNWWLLNVLGLKVQWTTEWSAWEVNFTQWAPADANGQRWPQWLAERNHAAYFRDVPEFDIVYFDNVFIKPRVGGDWNRDLIPDDPNNLSILAAHYAGHLAHWNHTRSLKSNALLMGNTADTTLSNAEWRNQLNGGFMEALMGQSWSIETWGGWNQMMAHYRATLPNLREPKMGGFNVWGNPTDYRFFRYAYASCLLDDGYFSFTDKAQGYSSVPWFDEYDHKLGTALTAPPNAAWNQGVWRRDFQNGVVLVNPTTAAQTVTVEAGLRRLAGTQDPAVNNGAAVSQITLGPKNGLVLRR